MRARDMAEDFPTVQLDDDALHAATLMAQRRLPGVVVTDGSGRPVAVLPGSQVLKFLVPRYVQEDPSLAAVFDERTADACAARLGEQTVRGLLPPADKRTELAAVDGDATVIECAAVMARLRSPLLVVADGDTVHGVLTASHLLEILLPTVGSGN
jgi:CBS domain-containing protein